MNFKILEKFKQYRNIGLQQVHTWNNRNYHLTTHSNVNRLNSVSAVQTCLKILSENISRVQVGIVGSDNRRIEHYLTNILNVRPNNYQNANTFWSIVEYHRNFYGNAYVVINRNPKGLVSDLQIIHPKDFINYTINNNQLYLIFSIGGDKKAFNYSEILHFRCNSESIVSESPLFSLTNSLNISKKAGDTLNNFYENNGFSTVFLESAVNQANANILKEKIEELQGQFGSSNAGKVIALPPNTKLQQHDLKFVDADTIPTLKFTRDEICSAYGVPNYMLNENDAQLNVEQQTLSFRTFTIEPILAQYAAELQFKLLTTKEIEQGLSFKYNSNVLIDSDLKTKSEAYKTLVQNAMMSPNEAIQVFGYEPVKSANGDCHYMQQQMIQVENYESQSLTNGNGAGEKAKGLD